MLGIKSLALSVLIGSVALAGVAEGATFYPANDGFELPNLNSGGNAYGYANSGGGSGPLSIPGGTYVGGSGVAANGSAFNVSAATNGNSDGTMSTSGQAGLLQGGNGNLTGANAVSITLPITLPAGVATLSYVEEARNNAGVTLLVFLDGNQIGTSTPLAGATFDPITFPLGSITSGSHTISFAGNNVVGGDRTTFIDNVRVDVVPEPSSIGAIFFAGTAALLRFRRRQSFNVEVVKS